MSSELASLTRLADARTGRLSSWDQRGRNQDYWVIGPHSSRVLADIAGPGQITHMWLTQSCRNLLGPGLLDPSDTASTAPVLEIPNALGLNWEVPDPDYYRKVLLRITWDGQPNSAVLVPLGDFFGVGHSMPASYASALFTVAVKPEEALQFGGNAALNSWVPMPFAERALIEVVNDGDLPYLQYFHIDYELYRTPLPADTVYFHARWHRSNPCPGWGPDLQTNSPETNIANLDGAGNFVVLETEGTGHYVGCNLSVHHRQGSWWGEGDEMIFVDDDTWPPTLHGTGTEDYFNHAWGMEDLRYPYHGAIVHESAKPGYAVSYRFHVPDPVRFRDRVKVSIEHGHGNHLSDDWSSTAYWYQTLPSPSAIILPVAERLPVRPQVSPAPGPAPATASAREEVEQMRVRQRERFAVYRAKLAERLAGQIERTGRAEEGNRRQAAELRRRFR